MIDVCNVAHHCRCAAVSQCTIFVHPSSIVQAALNQLMDAMAAFDAETGACSVLVFHSTHAAGVFTSVTRQGERSGYDREAAISGRNAGLCLG